MLSVLQKILAYAPSVVVMGLILYLSLNESPVNEPLFTFPYIDKVVHGCMYGGLILALGFDVLRRNNGIWWGRMTLLWCVAVLLGGLMEILQGSITQNRSADLYDFIANTVGATLGVLVVMFVMKPLFLRK